MGHNYSSQSIIVRVSTATHLGSTVWDTTWILRLVKNTTQRV